MDEKWIRVSRQSDTSLPYQCNNFHFHYLFIHTTLKESFLLKESVTLSTYVTPEAHAASLTLNPKTLPAPYLAALHTASNSQVVLPTQVYYMTNKKSFEIQPNL